MATGDSPTFEGKFFSMLDRTEYVSQPYLARARHTYRGVRESLKFNSTFQQIYADLSRLALDMSTLESKFEQEINHVLEGTTYTDVTITDYDATPSTSQVVLNGVLGMAEKLSMLEERIKGLENG